MQLNNLDSSIVLLWHCSIRYFGMNKVKTFLISQQHLWNFITLLFQFWFHSIFLILLMLSFSFISNKWDTLNYKKLFSLLYRLNFVLLQNQPWLDTENIIIGIFVNDYTFLSILLCFFVAPRQLSTIFGRPIW